jgi:glycerate kinase
MPLLLAAPDKFRGTATAARIAGAACDAARAAGWSARALPLADGGEGLLEALARPEHAEVDTVVTGPAGRPVTARWLLAPGDAVVESARASGLALVGGAAGNDPLTATSRGTGELVAAAARAVGPGGTVVVGLGGSATTDGGLDAVKAIEEAGGLRGARVVVACDALVPFAGAASVFAPQKGATPEQVARLVDRLDRVAATYRSAYGVDVAHLAGAGAAGGLGGGLAALGAELRSGYRLVADLVGLEAAIGAADLVVTGEGRVDATSFGGKVVGGVLDDARRAGVEAIALAGSVADGAVPDRCRVLSLVERFGEERAHAEPAACVAEVVVEVLAGRT